MSERAILHVAILEPLGVQEQLVHDLMGRVDQCVYTYYATPAANEDELAMRAKDADAIVIANTPLRASVLERCPRLRMISVAFTGLDHIDLDWCAEHGVRVVNCSGYSTEAVAEEAFGLMLSLYRNLLACDRLSRSGGSKSGLVFRELAGKTLGIVGNGAIARRVAELARAFRMEVICFARTERPLDGITYVTLDELCRRSDILSIHVPAVPETHHLIGAPQLALMKPTALLINTARGAVVCTEALVEALEAGRIAGAGLDVLETEPPFDEDLPILHAPNTVIAPHIGFATQEALDARARLAIHHMEEFSRAHWLDICARRGC